MKDFRKLTYWLIALVVAFLSACSSEDDSFSLEISSLNGVDFEHLTYEEQQVKMRITTDMDWTLTSLTPWIKLSDVKGSGTTDVTIRILTNLNKQRKGEIVLRTADATLKTITFTQEAFPAGEEYTYKLPLVFHVLYENVADPNQYIDAKVLTQLVDKVNKLYAGEAVFSQLGELGPNINLQFVLPESHPDGTDMQHPGVEYIAVRNLPWDCDQFMSGQNTGNHSVRDNIRMLWEGNEYINVFIYPFANEGNYMTLGISHLPYNIVGDGHELEGLNNIKRAITNEDLDYPHCISINAKIINIKRSASTTTNIPAADATFAHELGHYLGLYHAFNENRKDPNADSDYCLDTPPYNRDKYINNEFMHYATQYGGSNKIPLSVGSKRTDSMTGAQFMSFNLMDYEVSYSDRFTLDQRKRIRHVLNYSPFIPGPKQGAAATRSTSHEPVEIPMRYME